MILTVKIKKALTDGSSIRQDSIIKRAQQLFTITRCDDCHSQKNMARPDVNGATGEDFMAFFSFLKPWRNLKY